MYSSPVCTIWSGIAYLFNRERDRLKRTKMDEEKRKKCEDKEKKEEVKKEESSGKPHMGIPEAKFVEDVDEFMALPQNDGNAVKVLKKYDEDCSKYRFMEYSLLTKRKRLKGQIPELQKSIDMMATLEEFRKMGKPMKTQFMLSDPIFMKALVPPTDKVFLCIGANVILEYDLTEAAEFLRKNLAVAEKNLEVVEDDLDFLRDQFTTTEVNMARVFNWNIKRKQQALTATAS